MYSYKTKDVLFVIHFLFKKFNGERDNCDVLYIPCLLSNLFMFLPDKMLLEFKHLNSKLGFFLRMKSYFKSKVARYIVIQIIKMLSMRPLILVICKSVPLSLSYIIHPYPLAFILQVRGIRPWVWCAWWLWQRSPPPSSIVYMWPPRPPDTDAWFFLSCASPSLQVKYF